ncbi:hypothetical protein MMC07_007917 [Pseudocyphellaria aurata]|nr:hypothetical protein [Pseudocyphellaria aurata]
MESPGTEAPNGAADRRSFGLPPEILLKVFSILSRTEDSQPILHSCSLVSRLWYSAAVQALYKSPRITGRNFDRFINAVCPSINTHVKRNGLADMIKILDMSMLVHNGSKSLTARLLRRCQESLEEFVAPQVSFAINSFAALSKCTNLRRLDLSSIAYTLDLDSFMHSIKRLDKLDCLYYPRSCTLNNNRTLKHLASWPINLRELHIPGNLGEDSLEFISNFPQSLTSLSIGNCPRLIIRSIYFLLHILGPQLTSLEIKHSRIISGEYSLGELLPYLPILRRLSIPGEHISSPKFFDCASELKSKGPFPLAELELSSTVMYHDFETAVVGDDIWNDVWSAVEDGGLGRLRTLKVHRSLLDWELYHENDDKNALNDLLQALAEEDAEAFCSHETVDAGVWIFGK